MKGCIRIPKFHYTERSRDGGAGHAEQQVGLSPGLRFILLFGWYGTADLLRARSQAQR